LELWDAEPAAGVDLDEVVACVGDVARHRGDALERGAEAGEILGEEPVAGVHVDRVDAQVERARDLERLVELVVVDPELRRLRAGVGRLELTDARLAAACRADVRVHADPDGRARRATPEPTE